MSKWSTRCPYCGTTVFIIECKECDYFKVVCPKCFIPFTVSRKSGLPMEDKFELDPRHIV